MYDTDCNDTVMIYRYNISMQPGPHRGGDAGDVSPGPTSFDPGKGPIKKKKAW